MLFPPLPTARNEIEQTLQLARDRVEQQIARYRVWFYLVVMATLVVVEVVIAASGRRMAVIPAVYFAGCAAYAVGLRAAVARTGARDGIIYASILLDLLAQNGVFFLIRALGVGDSPEMNRAFAVYLAAPGTLLVLLINILRGHPGASVLGAVVGATLIPLVLVSFAGFHPAQIPVSVATLFTGVLGVAAARQGRRNLESFARLQLLRRYLSPAAVERVMRENPDAALSLGGELVTVTLLSADLRGFTAMSEKLAPAEVVRQLNAYHGAMLEQVEQHGGVLDKFIGDGTLVVFGLATRTDDHGAQAGVLCARDMLSALARHNDERAREGLSPLAAGIGVHTGAVVAGNIGAVGRRLEFTVIGDAVNTAARLEGLTKEAHVPVLVSGETARRLPDRAGLRALPAMAVRGREEPIEVWTLAE